MEGYLTENNISVKVYNKNPFDFLSYVENDSIHCCIFQQDEIDDLMVEEIYRKMKKGGLVLVFTNTKRIHTIGTLFTNNKFIVRDCIAWINPNAQSTSFGVKHILKNSNCGESPELEVPKGNDNSYSRILEGKRTLKLRNCFLPILVIQKPIIGVKTLVHNQLMNGCGLMNETRVIGGNLSSNIVTTDFEAGYDKYFMITRPPYPHRDYITSTVKVIYHLLNTFTHNGNKILDMTLEGGAGLYASLMLKRDYIGNEFNKANYKKIMDTCDDFIKEIPKMKDRYVLDFY